MNFRSVWQVLGSFPPCSGFSVGGEIILVWILPIARQNGNCQCGKIWQNVLRRFMHFWEPWSSGKITGQEIRLWWSVVKFFKIFLAQNWPQNRTRSTPKTVTGSWRLPKPEMAGRSLGTNIFKIVYRICMTYLFWILVCRLFIIGRDICR